MFSTMICNITRRTLIRGNARILGICRNPSELNIHSNGSRISYLHLQRDSNLMTLKRFKHSNRKASKHTEKDDSDDEDDDDDGVEVDDYLQSKTSKTFEVKVTSTRLDNIAKAGFKMSRNKIEEAFYQSKIRVNGGKVLKKSIRVNLGDEIDLIVGRSPESSTHIIVHRIVILSFQPDNESIRVKLLRDRSLLIEDYPDSWQDSND